MRIKSYFVKSVMEAMVQARAELGEDALLLTTRKLEPGGPAAYEIVFGTAGEGQDSRSASIDAPKPLELAPLELAPLELAPLEPAALPAVAMTGVAMTDVRAAAPEFKQVAAELRAAEPEFKLAPALAPKLVAAPQVHDEPATELSLLQAQLDEIQALIAASAGQAARNRPLPMLALVQARLAEAGFDAQLATEMVQRIQASLSTAPLPKKQFRFVFRLRRANTGQPGASVTRSHHRTGQYTVHELLRAELSTRVNLNPALGCEGSEGAVVAMVGPAGVGKTSMLTKIASSLAEPGRPVHLFALDNPSLASRMQLQLFARKAGVAFTPVEDPLALPKLVAEARKKEIVLIDTPALSSAMERERVAGLLAGCEGVDVHLAVPAYMSARAIREAIREYQVFEPAKLAITKLDESTMFGTPLSEAVRAGLSLSLISTGAAGPQNLHAASLDGLMSILFGEQQQAASA